MMRTILIAAALLFPVPFAAPVWAQGQAGQDVSHLDPVDLAARCVQLKKARGKQRSAADVRTLRAQCDELDRKAATSSRRR